MKEELGASEVWWGRRCEKHIWRLNLPSSRWDRQHFYIQSCFAFGKHAVLSWKQWMLNLFGHTAQMDMHYCIPPLISLGNWVKLHCMLWCLQVKRPAGEQMETFWSQTPYHFQWRANSVRSYQWWCFVHYTGCYVKSQQQKISSPYLLGFEKWSSKYLLDFKTQEI